MPDATTTSPTERSDMIEWLRTLPERTVLLDRDQRVWQVGHGVGTTALMMANHGYAYRCNNSDDMATVSLSGPFRVLWMLPLYAEHRGT